MRQRRDCVSSYKTSSIFLTSGERSLNESLMPPTQVCLSLLTMEEDFVKLQVSSKLPCLEIPTSNSDVKGLRKGIILWLIKLLLEHYPRVQKLRLNFAKIGLKNQLV